MQRACSLWPHLSGMDPTAQLCQGHSAHSNNGQDVGLELDSEGRVLHMHVLVGLLTLHDSTCTLFCFTILTPLPGHTCSLKTSSLPRLVTHSVVSFTSSNWVSESQGIPLSFSFQLCLPSLFSIPAHAQHLLSLSWKPLRYPLWLALRLGILLKILPSELSSSTESQPIITASIHLHWFISTVLKT